MFRVGAVTQGFHSGRRWLWVSSGRTSVRCSGTKWVAAQEKVGEHSLSDLSLPSWAAQVISLLLGSLGAFVFSVLNEDESNCRCLPRPMVQQPITTLPLWDSSAFFIKSRNVWIEPWPCFSLEKQSRWADESPLSQSSPLSTHEYCASFYFFFSFLLLSQPPLFAFFFFLNSDNEGNNFPARDSTHIIRAFEVYSLALDVSESICVLWLKLTKMVHPAGLAVHKDTLLSLTECAYVDLLSRKQ